MSAPFDFIRQEWPILLLGIFVATAFLIIFVNAATGAWQDPACKEAWLEAHRAGRWDEAAAWAEAYQLGCPKELFP